MFNKKGTAKLAAICGSVLTAASAGIGAAIPHALASGPAYPDATAAAAISLNQLSPQYHVMTRGSKSAECLPSLGHYIRTEACWSSNFTLTYYALGQKVGTLKFTLVQSIQLHIVGRDFTEHVTISHSKVSGLTIPAYMSLAVSCAKPCRATSHFHPGQRVQQGAKGTISYHDSVSPGGIDPELSHYKATFRLVNGHHPNPIKWASPISYRCDDALKGQGAGCVFSVFIPTLTSMKELADIARNVRRIQAKGPGHYGRPRSGHPLHRLVDDAQQRRNRRIACARKVTGPPPKGKSCDEYPFASTHEGGHSLPPADRGWAWVPTDQQNRQGGLIRTFYYINRVLNRDAFWVAV